MNVNEPLINNDEKVCYICLEECDIKSPCTCNSYIHDECLRETKKDWNRNVCAFCKKIYNTESSTVESSSESNEYESSDNDVDIYVTQSTFVNLNIMLWYLIVLFFAMFILGYITFGIISFHFIEFSEITESRVETFMILGFIDLWILFSCTSRIRRRYRRHHLENVDVII